MKLPKHAWGQFMFPSAPLDELDSKEAIRSLAAKAVREGMTSTFLGSIQITEDDLDLLGRLLDVDGKNGSIYIYDFELCKALKRAGYVQVNSIGRAWGTDRLRTVLPRLKKTLEAIGNG